MKCYSCKSEMKPEYTTNEKGFKVCNYTCDCGVARPESDSTASEYTSASEFFFNDCTCEICKAKQGIYKLPY